MNAPANSTQPLLTVVGARPQFIKSASLTRALDEAGWSQWLVHTGQHPDDGMGKDFLTELGVAEPDARLHPAQSSRSARLADMLGGIAQEIERVQPAAVIVYGDTDSTLAGALAAHHAGVPLAHIEAGLRSGDRSMPEEHNRIMTDQLSDMLFTTGAGASAQLRLEGVPEENIIEVGDVMLDVALAAHSICRERIPPEWPSSEGPVLVMTLHRPGNVDHPELLSGALDAAGQWAKETGGMVYFPVHPRTQKAMLRCGLTLPEGALNPGPLGYLDMQAALLRATVVLTDSGGVQKEAWFQGAPAVILRDTTEWKELIEVGASRLFEPVKLKSGSGRDALVKGLVEAPAVPPIAGSGLFGEGKAAQRVLQALEQRCC